MIYNINGEEIDCVLEFGEHNDHEDCEITLSNMAWWADSYYLWWEYNAFN